MDISKMNAREQLNAAAGWLGYQHEDMSFGLRSPEHGLKLWKYAIAHPELDEMADNWTSAQRRKALGYDPFKEMVQC